MTTAVITIATDFSPSPAGRHVGDGPFPGEVFREKLLIPALQKNDAITVDLDGTDGFGSSFLDEAFGGLVRQGFSVVQLKKKLKIHSTRKSYEIRIWDYIGRAHT